jgi:two-component system capsular synthesis response regulator RcsB
MKKIIVMTNCQYTRLAIISLFEKHPLEVKFEPINYDFFVHVEQRDLPVFIHIGGSDIKSITEISKHGKSIRFKESTFITSSEIMPFLCFVAKCRLKFINEKVSIEEIKEEILENKNFSDTTKTKNLLTTNEVIVLKKILSGMSLTSIAFHEKKSIKTISSQKISALKKLKLKNTSQSIAKLAKFLCYI